MNISEGRTFSQSTIGLLTCADNRVILGDNIEIVKKHCKKLMKTVSKVGFINNGDKTVYIQLIKRDRIYKFGESMELEGHNIFYRVSQFKYLRF